MMSVNNGRSTGSAVHYFRNDNYYSKEQGVETSEWWGVGAKELSLHGAVNQEDFKKILNGEVGNQRLGRNITNTKGNIEREHRPYTDVTFSAPKSISLLAEVQGNAAVRQAHENAVYAALDYMQKHLSGARVSRGKRTVFEKTNNLTVALFRHNTSRELDPQTHTHCAIMNATQSADGKWRSLTNDLIYEAQHTLGAIYINQLALQIQKLGFEIEVKDKLGNFEIKSIDADQLEHYSQRRTQIKEALAERGIDIKSASAKLREKATLMTRKSKKEVDHEQLLQKWQDRAKDIGLRLDDIEKTAVMRQTEKALDQTPNPRALEGKAHTTTIPLENSDQTIRVNDKEIQAQQKNPLPQQSVKQPAQIASNNTPQPTTARQHTTENPALEALRFAAVHLHEREMVVPSDLLLRTATQHAVGKTSFKEIEKTYNELLKNGTLIKFDDKQVTTQRLLQKEEWLVTRLNESKKQGGIILPAENIDAQIQRYEAHERLRTKNPQFAFTPGQKDAIALSLSSEDRFVAIQGDAGTGKTTMLQAVRVMAEEQGYIVKGMSVSGSATKTLAIETGIQSHTVKMTLINEQKIQKEIEAQRAAGKPCERNKELWVVDESSFIGQRDMSHLMRLAENANARVAFVGDVRQLSSPEAGKPFELSQKNGIATARMTEIRRQKNPDLQSVVSDIVKQNNRLAFEKLTAQGKVTTLGEKDKLFEQLVSSYMSSDRDNTLIITPFNRDRVQINSLVREQLRDIGQLKGRDKEANILVNRSLTEAEMQHARYYKEKDIVLFRRGYKVLGVPDNSYLTVKKIDREKNVLTLTTEKGEEVRFNPKGKNTMEVYEREERQLAAGDKIRFTRSTQEIKTGEMGTVKSILFGKVKLETSNQTVQFDLKEYKHWDHAYAVTVHASQGLTVDKTLFHIHAVEKEDGEKTKALHEIAKIFGERSFYVGVTRARNDVEIYTNDSKIAQRVICQDQDKTSSLESHRQQQQRNLVMHP